MKPPILAVRVAFCLPFVGGLLAGCGSLGDSLRLRKTVLVKVPIEKPIARCSSQGWEFRHVLEAPKTLGRQGQWYVAWNDGNPIESGRSTAYWKMIFSRAPEIARAVHSGFGKYPVLIEPNLSFSRVASKAPPEVTNGEAVPSKYGDGVRLVIGAPHMKVWPDGRQPDPQHPGKFVIHPMWHHDEAHSGIAKAQSHFEHPGEGVKIGHLDNGLDRRHPASPMNLERDDWKANVVGLLEYAQETARGKNLPKPTPPELTGGSHGMGTSGLLAGGWVAIDAREMKGGRMDGYYGWLGGAPYAHVVPVRVAPWVFSLSTGELAYGIDYASRVRGCDVITMSHGGAPTQAWVDAVNAAYERGTAMFAAESDFFSLAFNPFQPRGFIVPASPVYPAAFRRVIGVTGVTSDRQSYARNSLGRVLAHLGDWTKWAFRGSYGADGTNFSLLRPMSKPDPSQSKRLGQLRAQPIAAYSPNVPWITLRNANGRLMADGVDLDGAGTSAATPQVAAAAALWLQAHRTELVRAGYWSDWHKAEAVYHALLKSAERGKRNTPDRYLGAGMLKADKALQVGLAEIESAPPPKPPVKNPPPGSLYFAQAPNDYFDGGRSIWAILGLQSGRNVPTGNRAKLRENDTPVPTPALALQRLYYNLLMLRDWHRGAVPVRDGRKKGLFTRSSDETRYWEQAGRMAVEVGNH
ncbi:MAG: S8/S53 family peptidase [Chthoniobacteraceae bacterium]